jgi:hypothetical protein
MARKRAAKKQKRSVMADSDVDSEALDEAQIKLSDALLQACQENDIAQAEELLRRGAFAWMQDEDGWTSLHFAARVSSLF